MMSACYYPSNNNSKKITKKTINYRAMMPIILYCNVDKKSLYDIINITFIHYCNINISGYNKLTDEFWGKIEQENQCDLYFNLSIKESIISGSTDYKSIITIIPIVGTDITINKFILNLKKVLQLFSI